MTISKTAFFGLVAIFFTAVCFWQISAQADPPDYKTMSEDEIQKMLLKDVPLGSSSDTVRAYLKQKTGTDPGIETNVFSAVERDKNGAWVVKRYDGLTETVIGSYGFFIFTTYVDTYWEFDSHLRLIKLIVSKHGGEMP
ncbi:MAG TPA: hypothetical protein VG733_19640 [Chthoniobacteraceae bacterium]|nr:hypothetical protein [Chthoniobacteraceae bacterium]